MNKIPDLPPASGAPAPEGTSKRARLSADIDVESMPIIERLALLTRIEASLPATSLKDVSLEKALVLQLLTAQELQKAVLDDDEATPTQKSQVTNTLSQVIETLAKLQIKLFSAERMKDIEGVLIDTVNDHMTPEQANHFMGEYRRRLGASQE
jgi:hypothetical protein